MNPVIQKECLIHGITDFRISKNRPQGRCKQCAVEAVNKRRRKVKQQAVDYLGGKCEHCGGIFHPCVYDFHHKDPTGKDFSISNGGTCKSWETIKTELAKCELLCANCHRIIHHT